jgi:hypothetical protein
MRAVVDTNVAIVANHRVARQASPVCVATCSRRILELIKTGKLVLDDQWLIIREYCAHLRSSGQPGVGDAFLKWVLTNRMNPDRCELVPITILDRAHHQFGEFPSDLALASFDPSDRKFVAVARKHPRRPPILQAVDRKWWPFREILKSHGVIVEFLCPDFNTRKRPR